MDKSKIKQIENKARKLMDKDASIWDKNGWQSGSDVDLLVYKREIKVAPKSLPYIYYHIFEDANFHSLNKVFEEIGAFQGTYGNAQAEFNDYKNSGGRTWNL